MDSKRVWRESGDSEPTSEELEAAADEILRRDAERLHKDFGEYLDDAGILSAGRKRTIKRKEVPLNNE